MESGLDSWGWICTNATIVGSTRAESFPYGDYSKIGEVLGVLLSFDDQAVSLAFFRNGVSLGVAFDHLPLKGSYYPCVTLQNNGATNC